MSPAEGARRRLREVLTTDLRSFACLRALVGVVLACDVVDRMRDLRAHYTDAGVLSAETARALVAHFGWFSLHARSGRFGYQLALAALSLLLALALAAGFRTRAVTPLCWVLCVSAQNRFCLGDYPGDYLLAVLLLTGCFLPWGARFSVDAWRRGRRGAPPPPPHYRGASGFALLALFSLFIATAGLSKIAAGGGWFDGTAIYLTLSSARYSAGWLDRLLGCPALLAPFSYAVPWVELLLPAFLVWPWKNGAVRTAAVAFACAPFASFSAGLDVGAFPFLAASTAVGLLPPWFWERLPSALLGRPAPAAPPGPAPAARDEALYGGRLAARANGALCTFFLLLHVTHYAYKIGGFGYFSSPKTPPAPVEAALNFFRIKNIYRMFSDPSVFEQSDGWDVAPGELANGRKVNAFNGRDLSFEPPKSAISSLGSLRWRQYLTLVNWYPTWDPKNITSYHVVDYATLRADLARYLCRRWNAEHHGDERLVSVNLAMVVAPVRYARPKPPARVVELLDPPHRCDAPAPGAGATAHAR
ncbi:MAG TPA: hypothetical protein VFS43_03690 [Polyangiaceae bacterium]|nr:hypothetical protein [Polyangiaceae bacterium]